MTTLGTSQWLHKLVLVFVCCLALSVTDVKAQARNEPNQSRQTFVLPAADSLPSVLMGVSRLETADRNFILVFSTHAGAGCQVASTVVEVPIQMNDTGFEIKRALRVSQQRQPDGSCLEGLALVYTPGDFAYVATMDLIVVHLPTGPIAMTDAARQHLKSLAPRVDAAADVEPSRYLEAIVRLNEMMRSGQEREAGRAAEELVSTYRSRPPSEGLTFFATLARARRLTNNLDGAALANEVALLIAKASADMSPLVGVVYDNLATVRRLQGRSEDAIAASDRALAIFEQTVDPKGASYGIALHNRALIHAQQGNRAIALDYSERALIILRETLKGNESELALILEDNRLIREGASAR
jgi:tetratricopeptide (TPR) repeat protein